MRILIDLINNAVGAGHPEDHRYRLWCDMGHALQERGHTVYAQRANKRALIPSSLKTFSDRDRSKIDLFISHSPYNHPKKVEFIKWLRHRKKGLFKRRACHALVYDHGWLYKSLVVDRNMLFSDSYYHDRLSEIIEEDFDRAAAESYRGYLLENNLSKRLQPEIDPIPDKPFIFVPGQVLYDVSVVNYSKTGLLELLEQVIAFGNDVGLDVVFKPHPGMTDDPNHGRETIHEFCRNALQQHPSFHVVNNRVYTLMQKAEFTACVNSGSIVDNLTTLTPVYCCGSSVFSNSHAVTYNSNVREGLQSMLDKNYDDVRRKDTQLKVLWWLKNNLIQEEFSLKRNLSLLERHSGLKF